VASSNARDTVIDRGPAIGPVAAGDFDSLLLSRTGAANVPATVVTARVVLLELLLLLLLLVLLVLLVLLAVAFAFAG
jgi:hypothetical protein